MDCVVSLLGKSTNQQMCILYNHTLTYHISFKFLPRLRMCCPTMASFLLTRSIGTGPGAPIQYLGPYPFVLLYGVYRYRYITVRRIYWQKAKNLLTTFIESFTDLEAIKKECTSLEKKHFKKLIFDYSIYLSWKRARSIE